MLGKNSRHRKGEPVPVVCVKFNQELRYTQRG